jgi:hypothetical protein
MERLLFRMNINYIKSLVVLKLLLSLHHNNKQIGIMTIDKSNFHLSTYGRFEIIETPNRPADYISYTTWGEISSIYHYTENGVIRTSNHWGAVASCQWNLEGLNEMGWDKCRKVEVVSGYISFNELNRVKNIHNEMMNLYANGKEADAKALNFLQNF